MSAFGPNDLVLQANAGTVQAPNWITISPTAFQRATLDGEPTASDAFGQIAPDQQGYPGLIASNEGWRKGSDPGDVYSPTAPLRPNQFLSPVSGTYALIQYLYATAYVAYYAYPSGPTGTSVVIDGQHWTGCPTKLDGTAAPFDLGNYRQLRWHWNGVGTFAGPPQIKSAYGGVSSADFANSRGGYTTGDTRPDPMPLSDGSGPQGHYGPGFVWITDPSTGFTYDAGGISRSLLKANAFGSYGSPAGGPANMPAIAGGVSGPAVPPSGGWLNQWQDLAYEWDYIQHPGTPGGANDWYFMLALYASGGFATTDTTQGGLFPIVLVLEYPFA